MTARRITLQQAALAVTGEPDKPKTLPQSERDRRLKSRLAKQADQAAVCLGYTGWHVSSILLVNYAALTWNRFFGRGNRHQGHKVNALYQQPLLEALDQSFRANLFEAYGAPVRLSFEVQGRGALVDADNVCVKPLIDAMKGYVISDDSPAYVRSVTVEVLRATKTPPQIKITITEVE